MKKHVLVFIFVTFFLSDIVSAQTTGTFVVCDNGYRMGSCSDTSITLADIFTYTGIRDLNDPSDDVSMYKMFRLDGAVITTDELTTIKYSDYPTVFIKKMNATTVGHEGVQVFIDVITPPTALFAKDTLKYTIDKGATVNYTTDFFNNFTLFSSSKDVLPLGDRILFTDQSVGVETPMGNNGQWIVGKGKYKIRVKVSVCTQTDYYYDSIYVIVNETPCLKLEIKNMPSVCRDEIIDITPYIYVDGSIATTAQIGDMTFINKSDLSNPTGTGLSPTAIDMTQMVDKTIRFPRFEIAYQPNVALSVCTNYSYLVPTKVPTKLITTDLVISKDNYGTQINYTVDGDYYAVNDVFNKNIFKKLYLDNYSTVVAGTVFNYFIDSEYLSPVVGDNLTSGSYYIVATNPACSKDSTIFSVAIKNRDFDIVWQGADNLGKGYYTFNAPVYPGATYSWFVWGGSIVAGLNSDQVTVYYSEAAASAVTVSCTISFPAARTTVSGSSLSSAVYLNTAADGTKETLTFTPDVTTATQSATNTVTCTAYPNPAVETFALSGAGVYDIKIYNTLGQLVYSNGAYTANEPITVSSKGMHVIHLNQKENTQIIKVVLQ